MAPSWGEPGAPSNCGPWGAELAYLELLHWCSMAGGAQACPGSRVGPKQVRKLQAPAGVVRLAGPREPYWDCARCGSKGLYACRVYCNVCNQGAPAAVRRRLRLHHNELKGLKEANAKDKGTCAGGGSEQAAASSGRATRWGRQTLVGSEELEAHPTQEAALEHGLGQQPPSPGKQAPSRLYGPGVGSPGYMGKPRAEGEGPDLEEEEGSSEPKLPIKYGAAALSRALRKRGCQVLEAEQELEGAKRRHQEAAKCMEESEERLARVREEQRKCAELYRKAAVLNVAPKAANFLEADEAQRVHELLGSLKELLEGGARRAAR